MSAEFLSLASLSICFISLLCLMRFFGKAGLFVYSSMAIIISNIQVLKLTQYSFLENPVALGTVVFSTTFAVDNIITEFFGAKEARRNVFLGFLSYLMFTILMQITICHPLVSQSECINLHEEIKNLFSPSVIIFVSSLIAYLVSQLTDIYLFSFLRRIFKKKYLESRALISMSVSTFLDNLTFSILVWRVFSDHPISWSTLWMTYVFVTYLLRLGVAVLCLPLIRSAGKVLLRTNV